MSCSSAVCMCWREHFYSLYARRYLTASLCSALSTVPYWGRDIFSDYGALGCPWPPDHRDQQQSLKARLSLLFCQPRFCPLYCFTHKVLVILTWNLTLDFSCFLSSWLRKAGYVVSLGMVMLMLFMPTLKTVCHMRGHLYRRTNNVM